MVRDKVRIRFRKTGDLRLISHHDLMRCFERMLRRAGLPYRSTSGFNPKPRCIFALPLPLGIIGSAEVADLELNEELPAEKIHAQLARQVPAGLEILSVRRINTKTVAHVSRVCYRIAVPHERGHGLHGRIAELLQASCCWYERSRPRPRRFDLRPYVSELHLLPEALEMCLLVTPTGSARPDEVLELLGVRDLLEDGGILERTLVELEDECPLPAPTEQGEVGRSVVELAPVRSTELTPCSDRPQT